MPRAIRHPEVLLYNLEVIVKLSMTSYIVDAVWGENDSRCQDHNCQLCITATKAQVVTRKMVILTVMSPD